jgi:hypothetical protein
MQQNCWLLQDMGVHQHSLWLSSKMTLQEQDPPVQPLLRKNADVFGPPCMATVCRELTPEAIPIPQGVEAKNRPAFRIFLKEREVLEEHIMEQLEKGWIVPSNSSYGAPALCIPKPDGSLRMCIDYRALNRITTKNKYPLPRINDLLDNLSGAKFFSTLDFTSGYHQLVVRESDQPKTTLNTHIGKYEYKVLPVGPTNAPAVFQAAVNRVFGRHLNIVCVYLDDIQFFSNSAIEHLRHLEEVLKLLQQHKLKAKLKKFEFFRPELKFLGHIISSQGMRPDPCKVATVIDWPTPVSVYEVRSFWGLANFIRKYIRAHSGIVAPLTDLLRGLDKQDKKGKLLRYNKLPSEQVRRLIKDFAQKWTPRCQHAFQTIKQALTSAPVLVLPDFAKPFEVVCDACEVPPAVGAVLLKEGRPVAVYSRKLRGPELLYSVSDIEMLAVISAINKWRCYLEGNSFVIVTDHEPNTYLDTATSGHAIKRRARRLDISCGYNYTWCYLPGRTNVADPISRAPQHFDALCASLSVAHMVGICRARSADCGTPGYGFTVESTVSGRLLSTAFAAIFVALCVHRL